MVRTFHDDDKRAHMFNKDLENLLLHDKNKAIRDFLESDEHDKSVIDYNYKRYTLSKERNLSTYELTTLRSGNYVMFAGPLDEILILFQYSNRIRMLCLFGVLEYIKNNKLNIIVYVGYTSSDYRLSYVSKGVAFNRNENRKKRKETRYVCCIHKDI